MKRLFRTLLQRLFPGRRQRARRASPPPPPRRLEFDVLTARVLPGGGLLETYIATRPSDSPPALRADAAPPAVTPAPTQVVDTASAADATPVSPVASRTDPEAPPDDGPVTRPDAAADTAPAPVESRVATPDNPLDGDPMRDNTLADALPRVAAANDGSGGGGAAGNHLSGEGISVEAAAGAGSLPGAPSSEPPPASSPPEHAAQTWNTLQTGAAPVGVANAVPARPVAAVPVPAAAAPVVPADTTPVKVANAAPASPAVVSPAPAAAVAVTPAPAAAAPSPPTSAQGSPSAEHSGNGKPGSAPGGSGGLVGIDPSIAAVENTPFSTTVAEFTDPGGLTHSGTYAISVNWGDGSPPDRGMFSFGGGDTFNVQGSHTYLEEGRYNVTTVVNDSSDGDSVTITSPATVADANLTGSATSVSATLSQPFTGMVAYFSDADRNGVAGDYSATVDCGDGSTPSAASIAANSGLFFVTGNHTYTSVGTYTTQVKIRDAGGASITLGGTAMVAAATAGLTATEGAPFTGPVAFFPGVTQGTSVTIVWGDGSSSAGSGGSTGTGFMVYGAHTYLEEGSFPLSVTLSGNGTATGTATVKDSTLWGNATAVWAGPGQPFTGTVATFTDADPRGTAGDYSATIDLGDGSTPSAGSIAASGGGFQVSGSHTYATAATYTTQITIRDTSATITLGGTATVAAPTAGLTATEGAPFSGTVAFFPGTASLGAAATINWGDGSSSAGSLSGSSGNGFTVSGSHTYLEEGSFPLSVSSGSGTATGTATVTDAVLSGSATAVWAGPGQPFTGTVATFNDADPRGTASDYSATIDWGDGSTPDAGSVTASGSGFQVSGSHTYTSAGSYATQITLRDTSATLILDGTATIEPATAGLTAAEGESFYGQVAFFPGPASQGATATIAWGDGSSSAGFVSGSSGNGFTVWGEHTYAEEGDLPLSVSVDGSGTATGTAQVNDAPLSVVSSFDVTGLAGEPLGSGTPVLLATFHDANPDASLSELSATVVWGDGAQTAGIVQVDPQGGFDVLGEYTYAGAGIYSLTITLNDDGGSQATTSSTATISIPEGQSDAFALLVTPANGTPLSPGTSYTALINWGDGSSPTPTTATLAADGVTLLVTGDHLFEEEGLYGVSVSVSDPAGTTSTGSLEVPVSDANLEAWGQPFTAVVGTPFRGTVAHLSDANPYAPATDFSVSIDWGDGSTSAGTVTDDGNGGFTVAGDHTYASPGPYTVTTTLDDVGGSTATATTTATVEAAWTVTGGTRTDDPQNALLKDIGSASVDLNQGAVRVSQALDFDLSPGTSVGGDPALVYNSATVSVRPVVQLQVQTDPAGSAPTQAEVVLTWDGVTQNAVTFALGAVQPGQALTLAVQVDNPVAQSGHYDWSATLTFTFPDQSTTQASASGTADVVVRDASPYGAGWGLDGVAQLVAVAGGVLWVTGAGDSRYFAGSGGTFTSPAEDFGTLVQNSDGTYTYTATDQTTSNFNAAGYLTSVVDTHGLARTYGYDTQDRLNQVQAPDGGLTTLAYDPGSGLLSTITEPGNRVVQVQHDTAGNLTHLTDAAGFARDFGYDTEHHLTSDQWAPLSVTFGYDASSGLLTQVDQGLGSVWTVNAAAAQGLDTAVAGPVWATLTDAVPHTTQVLLDERGRLLEQIQANGATENYIRDAAGQVDVAVDALSQPTFYTYAYGPYDPTVGGGDGDLVRVDHPDGSSTEYAYDPTFHHVTQETTSVASGVTALTVNTYDANTGDLLTQTTAAGTAEAATTVNVWVNGLLSSRTDADGNVTEYFYDSNRRQIGVDVHEGNASQPVVSSESDTYDASGNPATVSNADGVTVTVNDANNQLVSETVYAADGVTLVRSDSRVYLADGQVSSTRDGDGNVSQTAYDQVGRVSVTTTTSAGGVLALRRSYAYDVAGNVLRQTEGDGSYVDRTYNAVGEMLTETARNANGTLASTSSDGENLDGEVTQVTDGVGDTTVTTYDRMGQALTVSVYDASGKRVRYTANTYDEAGNLVEVRDGDGNRTLYTHNLDGQVTHEEVRDASNRLVSQSDKAYDRDGNLVWERDGDGNITIRVFDADGHMTHQSTWSSTGALVDQQGSTFDTAGNETSQTDGVGNVTREVSNADGQVTHREVRSAVGVLVSQEDFTYDPAGQLLTARDGDNNVTTYTRNADGQVTHQETRSATNALVSQQDFTYDTAGNETSQIDGDGNVTIEVTNADGNVTHREVRDVYDTLISQEDFTYDKAGRLLTARDGDGNLTTYTRNAEGQVTHQETRSASNALVSQQDFTYDAAANETSQIDGDGNVTTEVTNADGNVTHREVRDIHDTLISQEDFTYDKAGRLLTARDGDNNVTTYTRNADGQVTHQETRSATNALVSQQDFTYDAAGNETSQIDGDGNVTTEVTNADGNVTHREVRDVYDTLISQEDFTYDKAGRLLTVRDGDNNVTTYTRNADGQVTHQETRSATNALVSQQDFTYDAAGNETAQIDGDGNVTTEVTNADGNVTHREVRDVHDTLISQEDFTYDPAGRLLTARDGDGNLTTYTRNADGQVTHQETRSATNALVSQQDFTYDAAGNETSQTDGDGNVTIEVTNADGNVTHREVRDIYDTLIRQEDFTYDKAGRLLTARDGDGNLTTYTRNADGQVTHQETRSASNALVSQQDFTYDTAGKETSQIDGDGNVTTEVTDADGNVTHREVRDASGTLVRSEDFSYDKAGYLAAQTDGDGTVTRYVRNADGQVTHQETRDATGNLVAQTDSAYDAAGNLVSVIDGVGRQTRTTYDADGHKLTETQGYGTAQAATTTYAYDDAGNLVEVTDPAGNHTFFSYQDGLKVSMTDPQGHTSTFAYDKAGRLISTTDRDGRRIDFAYDANGNKVSEKWYDASGTLVETLTWTYDADGNVLTATSSVGTYSFRYDGAGRVIHVDEPFGLSLDFTYDAAGNRTLVVDSLGGSVASTYDSNQLVRRVFSQSGQPTLRIDFSYDLAGNVTRQVRTSDAAGTTVVASSAFSYDGGRLSALVDQNASGTSLAAYTFAYDTAGQLTAKTDHGVSSTYGYDALGQLIGAGSASYSFDTNGNRTMAGYVTGPGNQLLSDGTWNYAYDTEGNLTSKTNIRTGEVWTYAYDNRNQLLRAEHKASATAAVDLRVSFKYDVFGNLIEKDVDVDGDGPGAAVATRYALDGWKTGAQAASATGNAAWDVWADLNGDGTLQTRYLRGDAIDEVFARVGRDGAAYWTLTDNQGSVRDVIDQSGAIKDSLRFDDFGNITAETDAAYRGSYGWTGRVWVAEVGLQYNRARWYDPSTGRWTSEDPEGFDAGDSNLQRYGGNAPTNATDPTGHYLIALADQVDGVRTWLKNAGIGSFAVTIPKENLFDRQRWYIHIYHRDFAKFRSYIQGLGASDWWTKKMLEATVDPTFPYKHLEINSGLYIQGMEISAEQKVRILTQAGEGDPGAPAFKGEAQRDLSLGETLSEGGKGLADGAVIVANKLTAEQIPALDAQAKELIAKNGKVYQLADTVAGGGAKVLHTVGPGKLLNLVGKGAATVGATRVAALAAQAEPVVHSVVVAAEIKGGIGRVGALLKAERYGEAQEQAVAELVGMMLGPQARQRAEAAIEMKKRLDAKDINGAMKLAGSQLFREASAALDQVDACKAGGPLGTAARVNSAVQGALAVKEMMAAAQSGDLERFAGAVTRAALRLDELNKPCFVLGTPVMTTEGAKPIEQLRPGDWVLSSPEDDPNGPVEPRRVEEVFVSSAPVVKVRVKGRVIGTTAEHRFGVQGKGWISTKRLQEGDRLRSHDGQWVTVEAVTDAGEVATVYNLRVAEYHTYFVGCQEWGFSVWAHNDCAEPVNVKEGHSYPPGVKETDFTGRKAFRTAVATATQAPYPKHVKARTEAEAKAFSTGRDAPAQYLPTMSNNGLEKITLEKGFIIPHGGAYHAYIQFDRPIGYDGGKATTWIRAELSGGTYHGHPMDPSRVPQAAKDFFSR